MDNNKTVIRGTIELMKYLKTQSPKNIGVAKKGFDSKKNRVVRKTFKNFLFKDDLHDIEFRSIKFVDCDFEGIWGFYCIFQNCEFHSCGFRNCRFSHMEMDWNTLYFCKCYFRNVELDECCVFNLSFDYCALMNCSMVGLNPSENIRFYKSTIDQSHFEGLYYYGDEFVKRDDEFIDILFHECTIESTNFYRINFRNSRFYNTILYKTGFIDCQLDNESLITTVKPKFESYATMDFQTVLQSEDLSDDVLSGYFNVKNKADLKNLISSITSQKVFSTVFISYSFKDTLFANKLNSSLNARGIRTFIWEKDAPGGKPLEEIMTSSISANDKLLFIASEHSIRSKACQYELTVARKKQEALWENVFFPITIDNYLFIVKKSQIRPVNLANEYWENIEEIKRVNALDFSKFNNAKYEEKDYEVKFEKIIDGLKIVV